MHMRYAVKIPGRLSQSTVGEMNQPKYYSPAIKRLSIKANGKGYMDTSWLHRTVSGLLISLSLASSPQVVGPLKYVTHGQCDTRPTVNFPAAQCCRQLDDIKLYCSVTGTQG